MIVIKIYLGILFSSYIGSLQCLVNVNYRISICWNCHFQSGSLLFISASSVCKSLPCLIPTLTRGGKGGHLFRLTCSVVLWGGGDSANISLGCVGRAPSVWTTLGLPQLKASMLPGSPLLRFQGALQGNCLKWALCFMHFPGLTRSGARVLCKDRLGWACVLCPSQVRAVQATRCLVSALSQVGHAS